MSEPPQPNPPAAMALPARSGCMTAFLALSGLIMLLPGVCSLIFIVVSPSDAVRDGGLFALLLVCLAIGAGGVTLLMKIRRRPDQ